MRCHPAFVFSALLLLAAPPTADAQDALSLFQQGRTLVEQNRWEAACPVFAEAHRLQPTALGILLNLADCYEHVGKTGSAYASYREAEFQAKKAGENEKAQYAHDHAATLEPKLSRLRIDATADVPGLNVHRDDQEVGKGILGTPFPVDPGPHKIEATAPGYLVWSTTVAIPAGPGVHAVKIPELGRAPTDGAPGGPRPFVWTGQRIAGLSVGAVGVAGLVAGGVLGGMAISKNNASKADCSPTQPSLCHADGVSQRQTAGKLADGSTGAFIAGGAAVVAGIVLFATGSPKAPAKVGRIPRVEVLPTAGAGVAGLRIGGAW